jgi:hypothetical protein
MSAQKPLVVRSSDGYASDLKLGVTLQVNAGRVDAASINCPPGTAPDADHRQVGDLWSKADGYYCRSAARDIGPFIDAASLGVLRPMTMTAIASMPASAVCFMIDVSKIGPVSPPGILAFMQAGIVDALTMIGASYTSPVDLCVVACGDTGTATSITRRAASGSDIAALIAWVNALTASPNPGFDAPSAMTACATFFSGTSSAITVRRLEWVWQGASDTGGSVSHPVWLAGATTAAATLAALSPAVKCNVFNTEQTVDTYAVPLDNTPEDGIPCVTNETDLAAGLIAALSAVYAGPGYLYSAGGTARAVAADAETSDPTSVNFRPCNCWITAAAAAGDSVTIGMSGQFEPSSGLDPGATYWLNTGGGLTATPPGTSGNLDQVLGWADGTGDNLFFAPQRGIGV